MILPFYFKRVSENRYLISNLLKKFQFVNKNQLEQLCENKITEDLKQILTANKFWIEDKDLDSAVEYYRKINSGLFFGTTLHIFVVTLSCNLKCLYCQAEYKSNENTFMSFETAERAVNFALQSPEKNLYFEFQGGEPLLNFKTIKHIIEYANKNCGNKNIKFSLVTNAQAMTEEILNYFAENKVRITFSVDGIKFIHDKNRPTKDNSSNFEKVTYWLKRAQEIYPNKNFIRALPTVTKFTLAHAKEFIDFYCKLGVEEISIRELSPFGRMSKNKFEIGYTAEEFLKFYRECMNYLIELNLAGKTNLRESFSKMILQKISGKYTVNYPDLRSPCGAATGQIAYNWNGNIYTCDEGRMLANSGKNDFQLGNVYKDSYKDCLNSKTACAVCNAACLESNFSCESCVYNPVCGICPVYSFFTQNDFVGVPIKQERCEILRGIYEYLIEWLYSEDAAKKNLCETWSNEP